MSRHPEFVSTDARVASSASQGRCASKFRVTKYYE